MKNAILISLDPDIGTSRFGTGTVKGIPTGLKTRLKVGDEVLFKMASATTFKPVRPGGEVRCIVAADDVTRSASEGSKVLDAEAQAVTLRGDTYAGCNEMRVEIGTNVGRGNSGDSGHGYRTVLKLENQHDTHMGVAVNGVDTDPDVSDVTLVLSGCSEARGLLHCLKFAAAELEKQMS